MDLSRAGEWTKDGKRRLVVLSHEITEDGSYIATEGDRWFLAAVRSVDQGTNWVAHELGVLGLGVVSRFDRWRPQWLRRSSTRERVQKLLRNEARRSKLDVAPGEFDLFSERIAVLLEHVINGSIPVEAIGFEAGDEAEQQDSGPTA